MPIIRKKIHSMQYIIDLNRNVALTINILIHTNKYIHIIIYIQYTL